VEKRTEVTEDVNKLSTYYTKTREELAEKIPPAPICVLDVGCAAGGLGKELKKNNPDAVVVGVEVEHEVAEEAARHLDRVVLGDVEKIELDFPEAPFDYIIFADILEHLIDPWSQLKRYTELLAPAGSVIATVPNIRYWRESAGLFFLGKWDYKISGNLDQSHLRFFTRKSLLKLFRNAGLTDISITPWNRLRILPKIASALTLGWARDILVWKWLITARKTP
jgi:2-polyprenyl-3-methyl-5-hydroxy-6-metoxy-1,4-benzoquinol methylase